MEFYGEFENTLPGIMEGAAVGAAGIITGLLLIVYFLMMGVSTVSYVLGSLGSYRIAKRRGIHHPWLAWIPVGNAWLLGSISDHYQYVVKHKATKRRKVLLILNIILMALSLMAGVAAGVSAALDSTALAIALLVFAYFFIFGVSVAIMVISYIAYYDLFQSCKPESALLFLILGIFFSIALPFFVFACSKEDKGMPAKRAPRSVEKIPCEQEAPAEAVAETPAEEEIPVVEAELVEETEPAEENE